MDLGGIFPSGDGAWILDSCIDEYPEGGRFGELGSDCIFGDSLMRLDFALGRWGISRSESSGKSAFGSYFDFRGDVTFSRFCSTRCELASLVVYRVSRLSFDCFWSSWGLLATISMTHLKNGEKQFPLVRLGATLGWMAAGWLTSYVLNADNSPVVGYAAAAARIIGGICALSLPLTLPLGVATSWRSRLGFNAFSLLKQRDHCVFFVVTALFSIPLAAFYMYAPELLEALGDQHPMATMSVAQISEVVAMLLVGSVMLRFRLKVLLMWALGFSVLRFGMSAYAGESGLIDWHVGGIALHGVCYTFYFITAQVFLDRRVAPGLRGQAQGLLSLVSNGIGPLVGAVMCGWLHQHYVRGNGQGWMEFWAILAAMIAACLMIFAMFYRGIGKNIKVAK
ncbi:MAG: nucleoside permease [Akkermansiaceae bacterium]|nr:nucleoside permease [Akkermansiaceae bacterium]